jgi:hypothetical protein
MGEHMIMDSFEPGRDRVVSTFGGEPMDSSRYLHFRFPEELHGDFATIQLDNHVNCTVGINENIVVRKFREFDIPEIEDYCEKVKKYFERIAGDTSQSNIVFILNIAGEEEYLDIIKKSSYAAIEFLPGEKCRTLKDVPSIFEFEKRHHFDSFNVLYNIALNVFDSRKIPKIYWCLPFYQKREMQNGALLIYPPPNSVLDNVKSLLERITSVDISIDDSEYLSKLTEEKEDKYRPHHYL